MIKAALEFSFGSCPGLVSPTFVSDLFSDRSETVSDLFSARSETNGPPPKVIAKPGQRDCETFA